MTTINSFSRQPTSLDYASPTQFKFQITKLPKVEYFCTSVNLPAVAISEVRQPTPFVDVPLPGTTLTYSPLNMNFLVDENLENFQEIHGWLRGLGFPESYTEYADGLAAGADRAPTSGGAVSSEPGKVKYGAPSQTAYFSDATLVVLTSKNNPIKEIRFRDVYPTNIGELQYDQQGGDVQYLTASVTFNYRGYDFANVGGSSTTVTTS
mgnify:FL=1|tara:strand:- start:21 stop:644 length:624 start_codon:yes stop_codon:yes gene_type:complete